MAGVGGGGGGIMLNGRSKLKVEIKKKEDSWQWVKNVWLFYLLRDGRAQLVKRRRTEKPGAVLIDVGSIPSQFAARRFFSQSQFTVQTLAVFVITCSPRVKSLCSISLRDTERERDLKARERERERDLKEREREREILRREREILRRERERELLAVHEKDG